MAKRPTRYNAHSTRTPLYGAGAIIRFLGCIACDKRLKPLEKDVLLFILSFAHFKTASSYPSVIKIAGDLGTKRWSVQRAIRRLEKLGYLFVEAQFADNGACLSNLYKPNLALANVEGRIYLSISADGWDSQESASALPPFFEAPSAASDGDNPSHLQEEAQREHVRVHNKKDGRSNLGPVPDSLAQITPPPSQMQAQKIWLGKQDALRAAVGDDTYEMWFTKEVKAVAIEKDNLILRAPSDLWVQELKKRSTIIESTIKMLITIIRSQSI